MKKKGMSKSGMLFSAIAMVMISVVALTTASFAWFTTSKEPEVAGFDVNVKSVSSLSISAEANKGFGTVITKDQLAAADGNHFATATMHLMPASPKGTIADGALTFDWKSGTAEFQERNEGYNGTGAEYTEITDQATDGTAQEPGTLYWVNFTSYLKVNYDTTKYESMSIDVNDLHQLIVANEGTGYQKQVAKALRVAFLYRKVGETDYTVKIVEPDSRALMQVDESGAVTTTPDTATPLEENVLTYDTVKYDFAEATSKKLELVTAAKDGEVYELRTLVWLEGGDAQCINQVSSGKFTVNLKFIGDTKAITPAP